MDNQTQITKLQIIFNNQYSIRMIPRSLLRDDTFPSPPPGGGQGKGRPPPPPHHRCIFSGGTRDSEMNGLHHYPLSACRRGPGHLHCMPRTQYLSPLPSRERVG